MALDILTTSLFQRRGPPPLCAHPPAGGPRLQHPVQFLQAGLRLRQRKPTGRDYGRALPKQALHYLEAVLKKDPRISVVGIAGPGDPFATPDKTLETSAIGACERHPEMLLCVASNGLAVGPYANALAALKVSHVTLTVNAVDPEIGAKVYAWVRDGKRVYRGLIGAQLLWDRQAAAIRAMKRPRDHGKDQHDYPARCERSARGRGCPSHGRTGGGHCQLRAAVPSCGHAFADLPSRRRTRKSRPSARKWPNTCRLWNTAPDAGPTRSDCWAKLCGRTSNCACCNRPRRRRIRKTIDPMWPWPLWRAYW